MSQKRDGKSDWDFEKLTGAIRLVHDELAAQANRAVNVSLTLRNWLIGYYIAEYEQNGEDRAIYGSKLLEHLSSTLREKGVSRVEERELRRYRQFYQIYPQIRESVTPELSQRLIGPVMMSLSQKREAATPEFSISGKEVISRLSFTHIAELLKCEDPTQRAFYEIECIRGNWSVRELKRQIGSLYYERSGLSKNKKKLSVREKKKKKKKKEERKEKREKKKKEERKKGKREKKKGRKKKKREKKRKKKEKKKRKKKKKREREKKKEKKRKEKRKKRKKEERKKKEKKREEGEEKKEERERKEGKREEEEKRKKRGKKKGRGKREEKGKRKGDKKED